MKLSQSVKSISYLQTDANIILTDLEKNHQPVIVTQNGQAKAVLPAMKRLKTVSRY